MLIRVFNGQKLDQPITKTQWCRMWVENNKEKVIQYTTTPIECKFCNKMTTLGKRPQHRKGKKCRENQELFMSRFIMENGLFSLDIDKISRMKYLIHKKIQDNYYDLDRFYDDNIGDLIIECMNIKDE